MSANKKNRSLWGSRSEAQRIYYQRQTIKRLEQENARLKDKIEKSIDKLEYYNSGEDLWYVPIQDIIDILKEN